MRRNWPALLALILLTCAAHWRVLQCGFVNYDDNDYVYENARVRGGLTLDNARWAFAHLHNQKTYWHPLTWLSHMTDVQVFGLNPAGHHATNLLLHILNVLLVFLILRRMTGAGWRSWMVAALFAVHPLQVDSVAWVSERKNLLAACFVLLCLWSYVRYAEKPGPGRYVAVFVTFALALMAKASVMPLPFALLLLDYWPLRRSAWSPAGPATAEGEPVRAFPRRTVRQLLLEKLPLVPLIAASIWQVMASHQGFGVVQATHNLPLFLRVENAVVSYARYLGKVLWPSKLCVLHPHPGEWPGMVVAVCAGVLVVATLAALWHARRAPWLAVGWFWFVGMLVPVMGFMQFGVQAMGERFVYVPLLGLLAAAVWEAADLAGDRPRGRTVLAFAGGMVLAAWTVVTTLQIGHWRDSVTLYARAVAVTDRNFVAHSNLAYTLLERGRAAEAEAQALEAVRANPRHLPAYLLLAQSCEAQGVTNRALIHYENALKAQANWPDALQGYARLLARSGRMPEAREAAARLVQLLPGNAQALGQAAGILSAGAPADAVRYYQEALRLEPDAPELLNNLAWLRATHPDSTVRDGAEAVRLAERACALTQRRQAFLLGTLAAAYAEAGRFNDAVQAAEEARRVATAAGRPEVAVVNGRLLEYYRAGKAYRQDPQN